MLKTATKKVRISALLPTILVGEIKRESLRKKTTQSEILTKALEYWLSQKLEKDTKKLASISFDDLPSENDWLKLQTL